MADRTFTMPNEPDLEELLRDDIMASVMRSAHVTADDLRQLATIAYHARSHQGSDGEC
ncbi:MAG TPA: hypothetical protein VGP48_11175 [Stellaceae bacterium]|jgi:hypothetical protein|nr:hypothetical protein [Stellaceae bacterium]